MLRNTISFFVVLFLSSVCAQSKAEEARAVVGQLEINGNSICGAVLVAPRVVLASAFCFQSPGVSVGNGVVFRLGSKQASVEKKSTPAHWENKYVTTSAGNFEGSRYDGVTVVRLASAISIPIYPKLWLGQFDLVGESIATISRFRSGAYREIHQKMGSSGVPSAIITYQSPEIACFDDLTDPLFVTHNGVLYLAGFLEEPLFEGTGVLHCQSGTVSIFTGLANIPTRRFILENSIITDLAPFNPIPPEHLTVKKASGNTLSLSWQDRSNNESGFQIFKSLSPNEAGTLLAQVAANATSYTDSTTTANSQNCYQVRSVQGSNLSIALEAVCSTIIRSSLWRNPTNKFDVNRDGLVSALDTLVLINEMKRNGSHLLNPSGPTGTAFYYDVDGDGWVTPTDTLQVINELNRRAP